MKTIELLLLFSIVILLTGCPAAKEIIVDNPAAVEQMKIADSLEAASAIYEAAKNYAAVAIKHPTASFYKKAAWKAAQLYSSPLNNVIEDSVALAWFHVYASLPVSKEEKENANMSILLLQRIITLQKEVSNLNTAIQKQNQELESRTAQIHDLEGQIQKTKEELEKLKDIDVKIHQRGTKGKK